KYAVATLHRPGNVDRPETARELVEAVLDVSRRIPVVVPLHPRGRDRLASLGLVTGDNLWITDPLGYLDFLSLVRGAKLVVTDSGGVQEETTMLGVPCLTVRPNTERPITVTHGTNRLVTPALLPAAAEKALADGAATPSGELPPLWDGAAGPRIARVIAAWLKGDSLSPAARGAVDARRSHARPITHHTKIPFSVRLPPYHGRPRNRPRPRPPPAEHAPRKATEHDRHPGRPDASGTGLYPARPGELAARGAQGRRALRSRTGRAAGADGRPAQAPGDRRGQGGVRQLEAQGGAGQALLQDRRSAGREEPAQARQGGAVTGQGPRSPHPRHRGHRSREPAPASDAAGEGAHGQVAGRADR